MAKQLFNKYYIPHVNVTKMSSLISALQLRGFWELNPQLLGQYTFHQFVISLLKISWLLAQQGASSGGLTDSFQLTWKIYYDNDGTYGMPFDRVWKK